MTRRAFIVLGPESSGTRLVTRLLIEGGCFGDAGHSQRLDAINLTTAPDLIVWRRSMPHARQWPPICDILRTINGAGYGVMVVVMVRERIALASSQRMHNHVLTLPGAYANIRRAYNLIFGALCSVSVDDWILMPYAAMAAEGGGLMLQKQFRDWGLLAPRTTITDQNLKHY